MDCVFCDESSIKDNIIIESEHSYVLMDEYPASEGHCLVISKAHYKYLSDIPKDVYFDLMMSLRETIVMLQSIYGSIDYNVIYCEGESASQGIGHVHWHIIIRDKDDDIVISLNENKSQEFYRNNKSNFKLKLKE